MRGGTALIPAAQHSHVETVRVLTKSTIDVDHVNRPGWTALLDAIIRGDGGLATPTSCGCSSRTALMSVSRAPTA